MTALTLRVWATAAAGWLRDGWVLGGAALCAVLTAALLTLTVAHQTVTPMGEAALVALLPLALAGSCVTTLLLPRRPVTDRAAGRRRCAAPGAPAARVPRPALTRVGPGRGTLYSQPVSTRLGRRPAAAHNLPFPVAAAGPVAYRVGRATVPGGAR